MDRDAIKACVTDLLNDKSIRWPSFDLSDFAFLEAAMPVIEGKMPDYLTTRNDSVRVLVEIWRRHY